MYVFLRDSVGWAELINPDVPTSACDDEDGRGGAAPFTPGFVECLRRQTREALRVCREGDPALRERLLLRPKNPVPLPSVEDLWLVAGGAVSPGQRLRVCLELVGVSQGDADATVNPHTTGSKALNEFLQGEADSYASLEALCGLLMVDPVWVVEGPGLGGGGAQPPEWLGMWCDGCQQARWVFDHAVNAGGLRFSGGGVPVDTDFLNFWTWWQAHPKGVRLSAISTTQDTCRAAWLFEARHAYRRGDETRNLTCTPESYDILRRLVQYHLRCQENHGGLPVVEGVAPPNLQDLMVLQRWLSSPPGLTRLVTPAGRAVAISPSNRPAPDQLPSQTTRAKRGRRPKAPKGPPGGG